MKIGIISPFPLEHHGGVQNHIYNQYLELKKYHQVKIITPNPFGAPKKKLPDLIRIGKSFPLLTLDGTRAMISLGIDYSNKLKTVFQKEDFDLLHFHNINVPTLPWQALELSPFINIITIHAALESGVSDYNLMKIVTEYLNRKVHGRIAVSKQAEKFGQSFLPGEYEIIPNGIDLKRFSPHLKPLDKFKDKKINILYVGRIEPRKGVEYLLKAFKNVWDQNLPVRLILVGDGPSLFIHKKIYGDYDVHFEGHVSDKLLPHYYATADIFCSPAYKNESFGIVLLEAMASGKPMVAGDNQGYKDLIGKAGVGHLVNPKKTKEFEKALLDLINHPEKRKKMGERGLEEVKQYDWKIIAKRLEEYYQKVMQEHRPEKDREFTIF